MGRKSEIFFVAPFVILLVACARPISKPVSVFDNTLPFHEDPTDKDVLMYQNPNLKVSSYSKFMVDTVKIYSNESSGGHGISPKEEQMISEGFRQELVTALKDGYTVVESSGPGVLRIRAAILDIQPAHMETDEDKFLILRLDTMLSRVSMELECVDTVSGEKVAALIHSLDGKRYMEPGKAARLANVREAFGLWTRSLKKRLDAARSKVR